MHVLEAALFANLVQQPRKALSGAMDADHVAARRRKAEEMATSAEQAQPRAAGGGKSTALAALIAALVAQLRGMRRAAPAQPPA
jgi:hypothetical protein